MAVVKCAHAGCCCLPAIAMIYCSTHCEVVERDKVDEEIGCGCGHFGCDPRGLKRPNDLEELIAESESEAGAES
jgi:hypothetical protein